MEDSDKGTKPVSAAGIHYDGVVRDDPERERAGEAARQSATELREALLAAQMGVWKWALETNTVTWDENPYRIAGRDPNLPAPSYQEHSQIFAPESWERFNIGKNARVRLRGPKRFTARCCSITSGLLRSS